MYALDLIEIQNLTKCCKAYMLVGWIYPATSRSGMLQFLTKGLVLTVTHTHTCK